MAIDRLVGSDATLYKYTAGPALTTGTATKGKFYKIVAKSGTTVFPTGFEVGDIWMGDGSATFSATNSASLMSETLINDCNSFSFEISADEIEVTVLSDQVKKYRKGKNDMSGTVEGINFITEMKKAGSILNRFLKVVVGDSTHTVAPTVNSIDASDFFIKAYLNDETAVGESQVFLFGQIELFGYNLGASVGDAQKWSSKVRFIGADPTVWVVENKAST